MLINHTPHCGLFPNSGNNRQIFWQNFGKAGYRDQWQGCEKVYALSAKRRLSSAIRT